MRQAHNRRVCISSKQTQRYDLARTKFDGANIRGFFLQFALAHLVGVHAERNWLGHQSFNW